MPHSGHDPDIALDPERFHELLVADDTEFCGLLECVLDIDEPVAEVYHHVLVQPGTTVKDLSEAMGCDPSTINRRLDVLRKKELVTRHRNLLSGGGIVFRYQPTSLDRVGDRMHQTLDEWTASKHEQIEKLLEEEEPRE